MSLLPVKCKLKFSCWLWWLFLLFAIFLQRKRVGASPTSPESKQRNNIFRKFKTQRFSGNTSYRSVRNWENDIQLCYGILINFLSFFCIISNTFTKIVCLSTLFITCRTNSKSFQLPTLLSRLWIGLRR